MSFILKSITNKKQLRWLIIIFFLLLALPSSFLINSSLQQLKWQQIYQYQKLADEFSNRINNQFKKSLHKLELLSIDDFNFLKLEGDTKRNYLQRSRLSEFPINMHEQGIIGYFQVDDEGRFSTPLLPDNTVKSQSGYDKFSVTGKEYLQRKKLQDKLFEVLLKNQLIKTDMKKYAIKVSRKKYIPVKEKSVNLKFEAEEKQNARLNNELGREARTSTQPGAILPKSVPQSQAAFDSLVKSSQSKTTTETVADSRSKMKSAPLLSMVGKAEKRLQQQPIVEKMTEDSPSAKIADVLKDASNNPEDATKDKTALESGKERKINNSEHMIYAEKIKNDMKRGLDKKDEIQSRYRIKIFETEMEPFELAKLETGELVLFRKAWRDNSRLIQGMIIDPAVFFKKMIADDFYNTSLSELGELSVFYGNEKLADYKTTTYAQEFSVLNVTDEEIPRFKQTLSAPFSQITMVYHLQGIPLNAGAGTIYMVAGVFMLVLVLGFITLYRLLIKQLALAQQQQNFVSSVSHELKTPLTSIRMYGEMLLQNWVSEEKKQSYYQYIFDESERLSRLISNVLQLSSISRDALQLNLKPTTVTELMDLVKSKVTTQIENSGFTSKISLDDAINESVVQVDVDAFVQIIINLVDNAIKFSRNADIRQIDISCRREGDDRIKFTVRDYGQGIANDQIKKIFELFYRSENELTRETVGTGIGLSLVHSLASAMHARVDVVNSNPGAEFSIYLIAKMVVIG